MKQNEDVEVLDGGCLGLLFEEPKEGNTIVKTPKPIHPSTLVNGLKKLSKEDKITYHKAKLPPTMTLQPWKYDNRVVEYKVKCKGMPKPFALVKQILNPEPK